MSRSRSRETHRRRHLEAGLREAVRKARNADKKAATVLPVTPGHGELWRLLCDIERAGLRLWDVARAVRFDEDERAMLAQAVASHLAATTPGSVLRRHRLAK